LHINMLCIYNYTYTNIHNVSAGYYKLLLYDDVGVA